MTTQELKKIVGRALLMSERTSRLDASTHITFEDLNREEQERYHRWVRHAGGNGGRRSFLMRLAAEGLREEQAYSLCAAVRQENSSEALPEWAVVLQAVFSCLPLDCNHRTEEHQMMSDFSCLLKPFRVYGERQLKHVWAVNKQGSSLVTRSVQDAFFKGLEKRLEVRMSQSYEAFLNQKMALENPLQFIMGARPSAEAATRSRQAWCAGMLAGDWIVFLHKYPVLARHLSEATMNWLQHVTALMTHLQEDLEKLETAFGIGRSLNRVTDVQMDVSDPHNGGRTVAILTFDTGIKVVYKPRSASIDQAWQQLIQWMESAGLPCFPVPRVIDGGDHSWVDFVEPLPVSSAEEAVLYYERAGVLLCLTYVLGGGDFHMDNIIAQGAHPVLVDVETLLMHRFKPFDADEDAVSSEQTANHWLIESVLHTGLLPVWVTDHQGQATDISGLTGGFPESANIPVLKDRGLKAADYQKHILEGYRRGYTFILHHRELLLGPASPLNRCRGIFLRALIRDTRVYDSLLQRARHPRYLKDGMAYSIELERLAAAYFLQDAPNQLQWLWNCFVSERSALEQGDIPIFYSKTNELSLRSVETMLHPTFFMETALDHCRTTIQNMSEEDLKMQLHYIQTALSMQQHDLKAHAAVVRLTAGAEDAVSDNRKEGREGRQRSQAPEKGKAGEHSNVLLREALDISRQIMGWRLEPEKDIYTWITLQMEATSHRMVLGPINHSFYDGTIGLGVFLAALSRITASESLKKQALAVIHPFRQQLYHPYNPLPVHRLTLGLGTGIGGFIRGLMAMGSYLREEALHHEALTIIEKVREEQIANDRQIDVLGGTAGLALALADLPATLHSDKTLSLMARCGQYLMDKRSTAKTGHQVWDNGLGEVPLTGMAHGAAGIAHALLQLYRVMGEKDWRAAALEAVAYENQFFDLKRSNWQDLRHGQHYRRERDGKAFMGGWCSGAPGIGLARLSGLNEAGGEAPVFHRDIEKVIRFVDENQGSHGDTLCCGNGAIIDFLVEASQVLQRSDLLEMARKKAFQMMALKEKQGEYRYTGSEGGVVFNPSFFHGLGGVGYTLLRCAVPDEIKTMMK
ncbi:type 2 lantibiotic biosynthesis protein LanM [Anoxynatronum buryatiense]|uniref:Type 2 lantibiotic biosynthesis protein LanM n=2 Tax=Anoxynatronum buryatiense TaxID=489973 RepID=A0AA45WVT1_9CLOT|nr:type 2 lantibiotic biosynthesis protein LanM [Anoxynatronum buryatiense]